MSQFDLKKAKEIKNLYSIINCVQELLDKAHEGSVQSSRVVVSLIELSYQVKSKEEWISLKQKTMNKRGYSNDKAYEVEDPNQPGSIILTISERTTMMDWDHYYRVPFKKTKASLQAFDEYCASLRSSLNKLYADLDALTSQPTTITVRIHRE
jgi:hypothetical protein